MSKPKRDNEADRRARISQELGEILKSWPPETCPQAILLYTNMAIDRAGRFNPKRAIEVLKVVSEILSETK